MNSDEVRVTHLPTGISATVACYRGQFRNKQAAIRLLRARLWAKNNLRPETRTVRTYPNEVGA